MTLQVDSGWYLHSLSTSHLKSLSARPRSASSPQSPSNTTHTVISDLNLQGSRFAIPLPYYVIPRKTPSSTSLSQFKLPSNKFFPHFRTLPTPHAHHFNLTRNFSHTIHPQRHTPSPFTPLGNFYKSSASASASHPVVDLCSHPFASVQGTIPL